MPGLKGGETLREPIPIDNTELGARALRNQVGGLLDNLLDGPLMTAMPEVKTVDLGNGTYRKEQYLKNDYPASGLSVEYYVEYGPSVRGNNAMESARSVWIRQEIDGVVTSVRLREITPRGRRRFALNNKRTRCTIEYNTCLYNDELRDVPIMPISEAVLRSFSPQDRVHAVAANTLGILTHASEKREMRTYQVGRSSYDTREGLAHAKRLAQVVMQARASE